MYKLLPVSQKNLLVKRVLTGEKIAVIARKAGVSRTIIYKWISQYKKVGSRGKQTALQTRIKKGKEQWKSFDRATERAIIKLCLNHPTFSPQNIAQTVKVSKNGVWRILKRNALNTRALREKYVRAYGSGLILERPLADRLTAIRRFEAGEKIIVICRELCISRTIFYLWLKKYKQGNNETAALANSRPKGERHWKFIPGAEDLVLGVVKEHPEFSAHRISQILSAQTGRTIVGHNCVHKILTKLNLNTMEKRTTFAQEQSNRQVSVKYPIL